MNSIPTFWLTGYENAALRKRLAYFRPWIEDKTVCLLSSDPVVTEYVEALAARIVTEGTCDLVFAPGVDAATLHLAEELANLHQAAMAAWTTERFESTAAHQLHQAADWPFGISAHPSHGSSTIYVQQGIQSPIEHASIGLAIPTCSHPRAALEAICAFAAEYPGTIRFALVANGVSQAAIEELKKAVSFDRGNIELLSFPENVGYGRGCNAGLASLLADPDLSYVGVSNDDVLPGTDALYELVHGLQELDNLGLNPGCIGPVSNEISGGQRIDIGTFTDAKEMRAKAHSHWTNEKSGVTQALQVRGLLLLMKRSCAEAVGGFDPRFGIGNFEDDDHNLRTRLAGFTLWIATGSFLFHHGSSTFKSLKLDYEANIRRNAESFMRKWELEKLEDWVHLNASPADVALRQEFDSEGGSSHVIKINGEQVDLVHQATDIEFAAWVMGHSAARTPEGRRALVELLTSRVAA